MQESGEDVRTAQLRKHMPKQSRRYKDALEQVENGDEPFSIEEACRLATETATAGFDESVDLDVRLGVDPRHADQMVRGTVALPNGSGREVRVLVLANESKQDEAEDAGADYVGLDDYIERIENDNWLDFEAVVATPDVMSKIGRLGRILGPRGLMPNPKSGTVTMDVAETVEELKSGKIEFRVDKFGNLHTPVGKASFEPEELSENAKAFLSEVLRLRPAASKGLYLRSVTLSATMGPAIPIDPSAVRTGLR